LLQGPNGTACAIATRAEQRFADLYPGSGWSEGRFKSQALLDEQAVLTAMAYVDLNPIRAKMADTPESSVYTSVAARIAELRKELDSAENNPEDRAPLIPFDATGRMGTAIPFAFDDYLELVDATGRVTREDKRGFIPGETPRLLERLAIDPEQFIATAGRMLRQFGSAIGTPTHITGLRIPPSGSYLQGMRAARALFARALAPPGPARSLAGVTGAGTAGAPAHNRQSASLIFRTREAHRPAVTAGTAGLEG